MTSDVPVTIAIPFHDEERYLEAAIRSILVQTTTDFELLLVDDGSKDRSLEIARSFDDPRIVVSSDGQHRGLAARLNEIARRARFDFVARMDADDVSHPTRIARELAVLRATGCDAVGTWAALYDAAEGAFAVVETSRMPPTRASALAQGILVHATMLARRRWLLDHPYDEGLMRAEDRDLWCRTAESSTFAVIEEPLYVVRVDLQSADFAGEYAYAHRLNRRLLLRYGPRAVGYPRTAYECLLSYAKSITVRMASRLGATTRIVQRRGRAPRSSELETIREALRTAGVARDVGISAVEAPAHR